MPPEGLKETSPLNSETERPLVSEAWISMSKASPLCGSSLAGISRKVARPEVSALEKCWTASLSVSKRVRMRWKPTTLKIFLMRSLRWTKARSPPSLRKWSTTPRKEPSPEEEMYSRPLKSTITRETLPVRMRERALHLADGGDVQGALDLEPRHAAQGRKAVFLQDEVGH